WAVPWTATSATSARRSRKGPRPEPVSVVTSAPGAPTRSGAITGTPWRRPWRRVTRTEVTGAPFVRGPPPGRSGIRSAHHEQLLRRHPRTRSRRRRPATARRPVTDGRPARRHRLHGALQPRLRAAAGRVLRPAHRGHRPGAVRRDERAAAL